MNQAPLPHHTEFRLRAEFEEVGRVAGELRGHMPAGLPPDECHAIEIAVAEALTNIVRHAYAGQPGAARLVLVTWTELPGRLEVELLDEGAEMDTAFLDGAGPSVFGFDPLDVQSLPEGGMGLALIKLAFDGISYRRDGGVNRLRLVKRLPLAERESE